MQTLILAIGFGQLDLLFQPIDEKKVEQLVKLNSKIAPWRILDLMSGPDVVLNTSRALFNDVRAREAVRLAIDNDAMRAANPINGKPFLNSPMGLTKWGLSENELALRKENSKEKVAKIEEARRLLAEARVGQGTPIQIMIGQGKYLFDSKPYGPDAKGQVLKSNLNALGLDAQLEEFKYPGEFNTQLLLLRYDIAMLHTPVDEYPDPDGLKDFWNSRGPRNYSAYQNRELDTLLYKQSSLLNPDARRQMVDQAQRMILDSYAAFYLPISTSDGPNGPATAASNPWVKNYWHNWMGATMGSLQYKFTWIDASLKPK
jgi:ABC-type transport system substrate-binding protein